MSQDVLLDAFRYPFQAKEWKERLLIAYALRFFGWLIVPLIPLFGYLYRIAKGIMASGEGELPAWDDWAGDFERGIRWFVAGLVFLLPGILVLFLWIGVLMAFIMVTASMAPRAETSFPFPAMFLPFWQFSLFPLFGMYAIAVFIVGPPALMHVVAHDRLSALLEIREWWAVFRASWEQFVVAGLLVVGLQFITTYILQSLFWWMCLFGVFISSAVSLYIALVGVYLFAHAYRKGWIKLQSEPVDAEPSEVQSSEAESTEVDEG